MRRLAWLAMALVLAPSQAPAWSDAGHKIVASIAFARLSSNERAKIVASLKSHPRFLTDFTERMPSEIASGGEEAKNEWVFQQAAVWPDLVRPPGPPDRTVFHRPQWHFVNIPVFLDDLSRRELARRVQDNTAMAPPHDADLDTTDLNAVQVLRLARQMCTAAEMDRENQAVMLAWLMHVVGDLHQPMHSTTLYSRKLFPAGDKGGNGIFIEGKQNLHLLWDFFPGDRLTCAEAHERAEAALQDEELAALGAAASQELDVNQWLEESRETAITAAYSSEILSPIRAMERKGNQGTFALTVSEEYLQNGRRIADQRLVQAGFRLGAILKEIAAQSR